MQTFPNPLWRRRLTTSWGAAGRLGVSPRGASVHRHYAVAVDRPAADRWLSDSERQACAALPWPERRPDWRAGRIAAKRAVARALGLDDPTRIELVPVSGGAPQLVLRCDDALPFTALELRGDALGRIRAVRLWGAVRPARATVLRPWPGYVLALVWVPETKA